MNKREFEEQEYEVALLRAKVTNPELAAQMEEERSRKLSNKFSMIDVDVAREIAYKHAVKLDTEYRAWLSRTGNGRTETEQEEAELSLSPLSVMQELTIPAGMPPQYSGTAGQWAQEAADFLESNFPRVYMILKYRVDKDYPWMSLLERTTRDLENRMDTYRRSLEESGMEQNKAYLTAWDELLGAVTKADEYVDPDMDIERGDEEWLPAWVMEALDSIY